jgi:hypothetical protein
MTLEFVSRRPGTGDSAAAARRDPGASPGPGPGPVLPGIWARLTRSLPPGIEIVEKNSKLIIQQ